MFSCAASERDAKSKSNHRPEESPSGYFHSAGDGIRRYATGATAAAFAENASAAAAADARARETCEGVDFFSSLILLMRSF